MTGPSSTPRGEHAGHPGANWETQLHRYEVVVPDRDGDEGPFAWTETPQPNRAARRRIARDARRRKA